MFMRCRGKDTGLANVNRNGASLSVNSLSGCLASFDKSDDQAYDKYAHLAS